MTYTDMIEKLGDYPEFEQDGDLWWCYKLPGYRTEFSLVGFDDEGCSLIYNNENHLYFKFDERYLTADTNIPQLTTEILENFINFKLKEIRAYKAAYLEKQIKRDFV